MNVRSFLQDMLFFAMKVAVYIFIFVGMETANAHAPVLHRVLIVGGAVLVMAVAWALYASPRSSMKLKGSTLPRFEAGWFGFGAVAAWAAYGPIVAGGAALIFLGGLILHWRRGQLLAREDAARRASS